MAIDKYLNQLIADKQILVDNLVEKGVEASSDETFTSLVPKVSDIETGGGDISEYFNTTILANTTNAIKVLDYIVTKVPNISIAASVTSLQNAFGNYQGDTIGEITSTTNVTNMSQMFYYSKLTTIPQMDTSNVTNMSAMFMYCNFLTTIPQMDTSNVTNMSNMFYQNVVSALTSVPELNAEKVINVRGVFGGTNFQFFSSFTDFGGFKNLGKGYTQKSNRYSYYGLNLSNTQSLTHDSLMNVINNLYDLNLTYDVANGGTLYTQELVISSTNVAKLTADEIAIATNKGWTVS